MRTKKNQAYHGLETKKKKYIERMKAHIVADELIKGVGWANGKGCAVGCTLNKYNHSAYETELGLPEWLARTEDALFEGLPNKEAMRFPLRFLQAIQVGKDYTMLWHEWAIFIWKDILPKKHHSKEVLNIVKLHQRVIKGYEVTQKEWDAAAWYDVRDVARDIVRYVAWDDVRGVESAAAYKKMANKLIKMLKNNNKQNEKRKHI